MYGLLNIFYKQQLQPSIVVCSKVVVVVREVVRKFFLKDDGGEDGVGVKAKCMNCSRSEYFKERGVKRGVKRKMSRRTTKTAHSYGLKLNAEMFDTAGAVYKII